MKSQNGKNYVIYYTLTTFFL